MNPPRLKTLKPAKQICLCLAPLLLVIVAASAFAQSSADDEVTPQVQALYAQAKAAQQRGDSVVAIEKYRAMLKLAPHLARPTTTSECSTSTNTTTLMLPRS